MKGKRVRGLNFTVDKLTNSIENVVTGDSFSTSILPVNKNDLKNVTKKKGWKFDWKREFNQPELDIFKLIITNQLDVLHGLISLRVDNDNVYIGLIENAPFNLGKNKVYAGVAGNLVAFACKYSYRQGHEGFVSFKAKTKLIDHYEKTLGAYHFGGHLMIIDTKAANKLLDKYYKI